ESKPKLPQLPTHVAIPRQLIAFRVEPAWGCFRAHPSELALGELAGGGDSPLDRFGEPALTFEMRPELAIPDGAHRGMADSEIASAIQRLHLIEEAGSHHRVEAAGEALMQHRAAARGQRPGLERHVSERAHGLALQLGEPPAGRMANLQSSLNSLAVVGIDAGGGCGIQARELTVQRGPAGARGAIIDLAAQRRRSLWQRRQTLEQCTQVEHGAADEQRYPAARMHGPDRGHRVTDEPPRGIALRRITDIDEVMRQPREQLAGGLGSADVETPIDQRRINAHD